MVQVVATQGGQVLPVNRLPDTSPSNSEAMLEAGRSPKQAPEIVHSKAQTLEKPKPACPPGKEVTYAALLKVEHKEIFTMLESIGGKVPIFTPRHEAVSALPWKMHEINA